MYNIGIDLGGTNIAIGIVDIDHDFKLVKKGSTPTNAQRSAEAIVDDMAALCLKLVEEAGISWDEIGYAGIATPGTANRATGVVEYANNLPFLHFPIADCLKARIPVKAVYIENDANAAAMGEAVAGAARGTKHSVMITLGTGVGGGIIIDHKVYAGFNYAGAELGHIVIQHRGRQCSCGRKGCWEAYSSATGLINMTREKMLETKDTIMWEMCDNDIEKISGKTSFAAARKGDKAAQEVVDEYIDYLACGLTNILNIFQPEVITMGGGVANERDNLLNALMPVLEKDQYGSGDNAENRTKIKIAELGNDAGIIGAAMLES